MFGDCAIPLDYSISKQKLFYRPVGNNVFRIDVIQTHIVYFLKLYYSHQYIFGTLLHMRNIVGAIYKHLLILFRLD